MGLVYLPTWWVDFYGKLVGKYTSPMDPMGYLEATEIAEFHHCLSLATYSWLQIQLHQLIIPRRKKSSGHWGINGNLWRGGNPHFFLSLREGESETTFESTKKPQNIKASSKRTYPLLSQWLTFWTFGDSIFSRENKVQTCFSGSIG